MMDVGITELFPDSSPVKIVNTEGLCLNRQRSMILSSVRAQQMRKELMAVKLKKNSSKCSAATTRGLLAA